MENIKLICNKCGRALQVENDIPREEYIAIKKSWGYFSKKDGTTARFILCEKCADDLMDGFAVPAEITETRELL